MIDLTLIVPRLREHIGTQLTDAVATLEEGIASGAVRNADFVKAKEAINRGVDQAYDSLDGKYEWDSGDPLVMGAWNVPSALKYALRKGQVARIELLTAMLPLHQLLQSAKPLIVKRPQRETPSIPVTQPGYMTCQVCGRSIGATTGVIALHGYSRPGDGSQTQSCSGASGAPYEVSRERLRTLIESLDADASEIRKQICDAAADQMPINLRVPDPSRPRSRYGGSATKVVTITREDASDVLANVDWDGRQPIATFEQAMAIWLTGQEHMLQEIACRIEPLQHRFDAWRKTHEWDVEKDGWAPIADVVAVDEVPQ